MSQALVLSVTLAWNSVIGTNTAGYKVYYGIASHSYTNITSVGNVTNATVSGLDTGWTYFFAVTTLGKDRTESGYSSEISYTVPCPTCPALELETNYTREGIYQLGLQTDVVYWMVGVKWTNYLPGWPPPTYFRLTLTSNKNVWQYQATHNYQGTDWYGIFGTVKSTRIPRLMITNHGYVITGTNYSTYNPADTNQSVSRLPSPFPSQ